MHFSWFDILLLISALGFVLGGFRTGLIQAIGGVIGLFVGEIIAGRTYEHFASIIAPTFAGNQIAAKIVAFILIFLLVTRLVGVVFFFVNKIFHLFAIVPGMKFFNRLGGAVFGFIEASLFIGISLQFLARLPISASFAATLKNSDIASYFMNISGWLVPLLPGVIKGSKNALESVIPQNLNVNVNTNDALHAIDTYNSVKNSPLLK